MTDLWIVTAVFVILLLVATWWARYRQQWLLQTVDQVIWPDFPSLQLGNNRDIYIFLPPGYVETDRYPLLVLNDGQDLQQLQLHATLARLISRRAILPLIVVAIPTDEERLQEYGTAVAANAQGLGTRAGHYANFVIEELLPAVEKAFAVSNSPADRAILGASLGGLSAFDLAWHHPQLFGSCGVFSGSFWWRAAPDETAVAPGRRIAHTVVRAGEHHPGQRFWFEAGTQDEASDRDNNGVIDAIQDTLELIDELVSVGYQAEEDIIYLEVRGGRHNYDTWAEVLPDFLRWAFPGSG